MMAHSVLLYFLGLLNPLKVSISRKREEKFAAANEISEFWVRLVLQFRSYIINSNRFENTAQVVFKLCSSASFHRKYSSKSLKFLVSQLLDNSIRAKIDILLRLLLKLVFIKMLNVCVLITLLL